MTFSKVEKWESHQIAEDDVAELAEVDVVLQLRGTIVKVEGLDVVKGFMAGLALDLLGLGLRSPDASWLWAPSDLLVVSGLYLQFQEALYRMDL